jgi:transcriptional regulator PpsR
VTTGPLKADKPGGGLQTLSDQIGILDAETSATLALASADIVLVLTPEGVVRHAALIGEDFGGTDHGAWIGKPWAQLVTGDSKVKVEQLLDLPSVGPEIRWREITCRGRGGDTLPARFTTVPLPNTGLLLALGRSLRAVSNLQQRLIEVQQSMERDYSLLRQAESRYRQLAQLTAEGILVLEGSPLKVIEANPAAVRLLGANGKLVGRTFADLFDTDSRATIDDISVSLRATGRVDDVDLLLPGRGRTVRVSGSLYRQGGSSQVFIRLTGAGIDLSLGSRRSKFQDVIARSPDAMVVIDAERRIVEVNSAFLELAGLGSEEQARGQLVDRWLGRGLSDLNLILNNIRDHGSVRDLVTVLRGEYETSEPVDVTGVLLPHPEQPHMGLVIRPSGRVGRSPLDGERLPYTADELLKLVGRMSLKGIVRETADVIEKLCVEAALRATGDNRASAAQMLGLSRQSLYAKLRRYGLTDQDFDEEN